MGETQSKYKITHFNYYPVTRVVFCYVDKWKGKGKVHPRTGHEGPEGQ
jgi:hypothetical protein